MESTSYKDQIETQLIKISYGIQSDPTYFDNRDNFLPQIINEDIEIIKLKLKYFRGVIWKLFPLASIININNNISIYVHSTDIELILNCRLSFGISESLINIYVNNNVAQHICIFNTWITKEEFVKYVLSNYLHHFSCSKIIQFCIKDYPYQKVIIIVDNLNIKNSVNKKLNDIIEFLLASKNMSNNQDFSNFCKSIINVKIGETSIEPQNKNCSSSTYLFNDSNAYLLIPGNGLSNLTKNRSSLILYDPSRLMDLNDTNTDLIVSNMPIINIISDITLLKVENNNGKRYQTEYLSREVKCCRNKFLSLPLPSDYLGKAIFHGKLGEINIEIIGYGHSASIIDGNTVYEITYIAEAQNNEIITLTDGDSGSCVIKSDKIHSFYVGDYHIKDDNYKVEKILYKLTPSHFAYYQAEEILDYKIEGLKYSIEFY